MRAAAAVGVRAVSLLQLLLATLPALAGSPGWSSTSGAAAAPAVGSGGPEFSSEQRLQVVGAASESAELACAVRHQGDKSVSWVRTRDLQIMSHAGSVFTADTRVSAREQRVSDVVTRHVLHVRALRPSDAGLYECQLNTEPKMSLFFNLTVLASPLPVAVVSAAAREVHGAVGGAATLRCAARYSPTVDAPLPELDIRWYKDDQPVSIQGWRSGGVSLEARRGGAGGGAESRLTLAALGARDAGRYTCAAPHTPAADYVMLFVDDSSVPSESMQRDEAVAARAAAAAGPRGAHTSPRELLPLPLLLLLERLVLTAHS